MAANSRTNSYSMTTKTEQARAQPESGDFESPTFVGHGSQGFGAPIAWPPAFCHYPNWG